LSDSEDTYTLVGSSTSSRLFLAYAAMHQLDRGAGFVAAFLNGSLQEEIYLTKSPGVSIS
jgi:hypothetical protein